MSGFQVNNGNLSPGDTDGKTVVYLKFKCNQTSCRVIFPEPGSLCPSISPSKGMDAHPKLAPAKHRYHWPGICWHFGPDEGYSVMCAHTHKCHIAQPAQASAQHILSLVPPGPPFPTALPLHPALMIESHLRARASLSGCTTAPHMLT